MASIELSLRIKARHLDALRRIKRKAGSLQEMSAEMREVARQFILEPLQEETVEAMRQTFEDRIAALKTRRIIYDGKVVSCGAGPDGIDVAVVFTLSPAIERVMVDFHIGPVGVGEPEDLL